MKLEDELRTLILSQYRSIREFSSKVELPQSTIDSILHRGIMNAGVGKIIKICQHLGISADALAHGRIRLASEIGGNELTYEESQHIAKYRALDDAGREFVDSMIDKLHEQHSSKSTESWGEITAS